MRPLTALIGTLVESWQEIRVHKGRVVLSLLGVCVAVASLSIVVGMGSLAQRATEASLQQSNGRPATYTISPKSQSVSDRAVEQASVDALRAAAVRHGVRYVSEQDSVDQAMQLVGASQIVQTNVIDVPYATIHSLRMEQGRWFDEADRDRLAPAMVLNATAMEQLGDPDLRSHPTVRIQTGEKTVTAVVIGQVATTTSSLADRPMAWVLSETPTAVAMLGVDDFPRSFEVWLPTADSAALVARLVSDTELSNPDGPRFETRRADAPVYDGVDALTIMIAAASSLVLLLGGLGLLSVSLVSVRQRIREIGVRRAVGASAVRVFIAVVFENVLATLVAGGIGVAVGAMILGAPALRNVITAGTEVGGGAFPLDAALIGIGSAVFVGLVSGVFPAVVATRVKVIDAIRF